MPSARWCRIETNLSFDLALPTELEGCDVAGEFWAIRSGCSEEVFARMRSEDDVRPVHLGVELFEVWWYERVVLVRIYWHVCPFIDHVDADTVAGLHEGV